MSILVIADFHINFYDNRKELILKFFNEVASQFDKIIILGDFFEFWYGFKDVIISHYFDFLSQFKILRDQGKEIIFIEGNHDFNMGSFFTDFLKIKVYDEFYEEIINNKSFLFMHGDTINIEEDKFYYRLRNFLRSKFTTFLMNNLPPYLILKIAKKFSQTSRNYLFKNFELEKIIDNFQRRKNYDYIITGHFHTNFQYKNFYILDGINSRVNYIVINNNGEISYHLY